MTPVALWSAKKLRGRLSGMAEASGYLPLLEGDVRPDEAAGWRSGVWRWRRCGGCRVVPPAAAPPPSAWPHPRWLLPPRRWRAFVLLGVAQSAVQFLSIDAFRYFASSEFRNNTPAWARDFTLSPARQSSVSRQEILSHHYE